MAPDFTKITYTQHARDEMLRRGITEAMVKSTLMMPDAETPDTDPQLMRRFKEIEQYGQRILRVVYKESDAGFLIITTFFDRRAKKHLGGSHARKI